MDVEEIVITLKFLGSEEQIEMSLPLNLEIPALKTLATDYTDIPQERMRLLWRANALRDGTLASNNVEDGAVIKIVPQRDQQAAATARAQYEAERLRRPRDADDRINDLRRTVVDLQQQVAQITRHANTVLCDLNRHMVNAFRSLNQLQMGLTGEMLQRWNDVRSRLSGYDAQLDAGRIVIREGRRAAVERPAQRGNAQAPPRVMNQQRHDPEPAPAPQAARPAPMPVPGDAIFSQDELQMIERDANVEPRANFQFSAACGQGKVFDQSHV